MEVRELKPGEAPPRRLGSTPYLNKLSIYVDICQQIKNGEPVNRVLTFGPADQNVANGHSPEKIAGKVAERFKKQLVRCYGKGLVKDHNYAIYQNSNEVIVQQLADDDKLGFAHTDRGKKAIPAIAPANKQPTVSRKKRKD
jgi:hypothetical protein